MSKITQKLANKLLRHNRVRSRISGTSERPRLNVYISNSHVYAQVIDDTKSHTLLSANSATAKDAGSTITEKAAWVGAKIAEQAKKAKINAVAFDRGSRRYHGRLQALATAARKGGLEF